MSNTSNVFNIPTGFKTYTTEEAAEILKTSTHALANWRVRGMGPRYIKSGRRVLYRHSDIEAWFDKQSKQNTAS